MEIVKPPGYRHEVAREGNKATVFPFEGSSKAAAAWAAIELARLNPSIDVAIEFNGIRVRAGQHDTIADVEKRLFEAQDREYQVFLNTPEGQERRGREEGRAERVSGGPNSSKN